MWSLSNLGALENQADYAIQAAWHRICSLDSRRSLEGSSKVNCAWRLGGWGVGGCGGVSLLAHRHMHPIL